MTIKEANLKVGDRYKTAGGTGPWIVQEIVSRGVVSTHIGIESMNEDYELYWVVPPGSHKHLDEWNVEIW